VHKTRLDAKIDYFIHELCYQKSFFLRFGNTFLPKGLFKTGNEKKCRARRHRFVAVARLKDFPVI
jgi:hypothetical protein